MVRGTKITDKTMISFSNDYPLRLDFITPNLSLGFILAPRVESEE